MRNVLITGTPRSGTTLVCSLLNKLPDTIALHEPMDVWQFPKCANHAEAAELVAQFIEQSRASLISSGVAISTHVGGEITDNIASAKADRTGSRTRSTERGPVKFAKSLSPDFTLAIKHPVAFTAMLPTLSARFECIAIIRNPLATLASWNSLRWINVRNGHAPIGEQLDGELKTALSRMPDVYDRQLHILQWFYGRFRGCLPAASVFRYEDIVATRGHALSEFFPAATELDKGLGSQNLSEHYDRQLMRELGERLLAQEGDIWAFYAKSDVERLLRESAGAT